LEVLGLNLVLRPTLLFLHTRLCYEGYEMLCRLSEEIMGRISGSLKKADKKSPGAPSRHSSLLLLLVVILS
jgi:hypothetical protein